MSEPCLAAPRGTLVVLSAPSGTGKTTLVQRLRAACPDLAVSISATTRPPRRGERDGVHYHFLTRDDFRRRVAADLFLEHAEVHGNLYGTLRDPVEAHRDAGRDVLLEIDVEGARQVRAHDPEARLVFILPPSRAELESRLRRRDLDADDVIARRLDNAAREVACVLDYDHVVVNDDLEDALARLVAVVSSYRQTVAAQRRRILEIQATFRAAGGRASA